MLWWVGVAAGIFATTSLFDAEKHHSRFQHPKEPQVGIPKNPEPSKPVPAKLWSAHNVQVTIVIH